MMLSRSLAPLLFATLVSGGCTGAGWNPMLWGRGSAQHQVASLRAQADECRERGDAAQRAGDREDALYYRQESAYLQTRANQLEATWH